MKGTTAVRRGVRCGAFLMVWTLAMSGCSSGTAASPASTTAPSATGGSGASATPTASGSGTGQASTGPDLGTTLGQRSAAGIPGCPATGSGGASPGDTSKLPAVTFWCLGQDSRVNLGGLRGGPWIINFWATWCGPCQHESPALGAFAARAQGKLRFLGVDIDDVDEAAIAFAQQSGIKYPQVVSDRKTIYGMRIVGLPETWFVTADGRIAHRELGGVDAQSLPKLAKQYLGVDVP